MSIRRRAGLVLCCTSSLAVACSVDDRAVQPLSAGGAGGSASSSAADGLPPSNTPAMSSGGPSGAACADSSCAGAANVPPLPGGCAEGQRRCVEGAPEVCSAGTWSSGAACAEPLGFCLPRTGLCASCRPGGRRCTGERVEGCNDDGAWTDLGMPCTECVPREADCVGTTARVCSELGAWVGQTCSGTLPVCVAATGTCACSEASCGAREVCAASGRCEPLGPDCPMPAPVGTADQDLAIVRVRFDPDGSADVLMQNVGGGFISYAAQAFQLCNGANDCVFLGDTQSVTLVGDDSFSRRIPSTVPSGGELAVVLVSSDFPTATEAYVAWGSGAGGGSFEPVVNDDLRLWNTGERIAIEPGDTGFVCTGNASSALGYTSCHP